MAPGYYWVSDEAWSKIEPRLPKNNPGRKKLFDDRLVISAIIHMLKTGTPWSNCPEFYGIGTTIYQRWVRWGRRGIWTSIVQALSEEEWDRETATIDQEYKKFYYSITNKATSRGELPISHRISKPRRNKNRKI